MDDKITVDNGDGTTTDFLIVAKGPTVHLRMPRETAEEWLRRLNDLLQRPGAKVIPNVVGSIIAVEVP